ncbi:hypothetical protein CF319_g8638 [Tilletia indica]|nr:hypothetical protein CF319_g8638 [Tilletia indica]
MSGSARGTMKAMAQQVRRTVISTTQHAKQATEEAANAFFNKLRGSTLFEPHFASILPMDGAEEAEDADGDEEVETEKELLSVMTSVNNKPHVPGEVRHGSRTLAAIADEQGRITYAHQRYVPVSSFSPTEAHSPLTWRDFFDTVVAAKAEAADESLPFGFNLRQTLIRTSPQDLAKRRFEGLTPAGITLFTAFRDGADIPLPSDFPASALARNNSSITLGIYMGIGRSSSPPALLSPNNGSNLAYVGRVTDNTMNNRMYGHDYSARMAVRNPNQLSAVLYEMRREATGFDYVVVSSLVGHRINADSKNLVAF